MTMQNICFLKAMEEEVKRPQKVIKRTVEKRSQF